MLTLIQQEVQATGESVGKVTAKISGHIPSIQKATYYPNPKDHVYKTNTCLAHQRQKKKKKQEMLYLNIGEANKWQNQTKDISLA